MKAVRIHHHGDLSAVQIDDILEPALRPGTAKIRMAATALNHMDLWVRKGLPGVPLPIILGCEGVGAVEAVGEGCSHVKPGDRVLVQPGLSCGVCASCAAGHDHYCAAYQILGEHTDGCHAEKVVLPAENIFPLPDSLPSGLSFQDLAALPLAFLTAWQMLVHRARVKPGEIALIVAAASGVGSAAVQIAKLYGATVIATAGDEAKLKRATALGADFAINHRTDSLAKRVKAITGGRGVDVVFEHVGAAVWVDCLKSLAPRGRLITCGATSGPKVEIDLRHVFIKNLQIWGSTMGSRGDLHAIFPHVLAGRLKPVVDRVFPFSEARAAQAHLEGSQNFGKVLLAWDTDSI